MLAAGVWVRVFGAAVVGGGAGRRGGGKMVVHRSKWQGW